MYFTVESEITAVTTDTDKQVYTFARSQRNGSVPKLGRAVEIPYRAVKKTDQSGSFRGLKSGGPRREKESGG